MNQTEGLQDFRRRQEGHLIIADDAWLPKKTLETFGVNRQDLVNGSEHDVLKKHMYIYIINDYIYTHTYIYRQFEETKVTVVVFNGFCSARPFSFRTGPCW